MIVFLLLFLAVAINILLGIFVILKNPHSKTNISFSLFVFSLSFFLLFSIFLQIYQTTFLGRVVFGVATIALASLFYFEEHFPVQRNRESFVRLLFIGLGLVLSAVSVATNMIVYDKILIDGAIGAVYGDLYFVFVLYLLISLVSFVYNLVRKYKKLGDLKRSQIRFLILGVVFFMVAVVFTNIVLPHFGLYKANKIGPVFSVVFTAFTGYAIVRYRLMDIRLVITRSLIYAFLVSFVTGAFVLTTYIGSLYFSQESSLGQVGVLIVSSLAIVLLLDPLKKLLARATNAIFFKAAIDYPVVTKKLTNIINEEIELDHLVKRFSAALEDELRLQHATILLPMGAGVFIEPEELKHASKATRSGKEGKSHSLPNNNLTKELTKRQEILILDELDRRVADAREEKERKRLGKVRDELEATGGYAVVPISDDTGLQSVIMLSRKLSGEAFSNNDIQLLEVIAPQMASGIQKARLYQEQKEFGAKLQREVNKATAELKDANSKLMDLDKAKSEFMSIASHQLRTPLAGIMGYLSMLDAGDYGKIKPEQGEIIKDVLEATQRLIRMVNVFLNVTRIEAGRFVMNYTKNSFDALIEEIYKVLKPTADKKGVKLTFKSSKKLPEIEVDADKIKDVILNFTDNAIKYSPEGEVTIWGEATKKTVIFHCKDTGVGIAKEEVDNLFSKFVRGSGIAQVDPSGSGLGLFIAKKVTEGLGGRVWAESEGEGKGSTFKFEIPIKADPEAKKKAEEFKQRAKE